MLEWLIRRLAAAALCQHRSPISADPDAQHGILHRLDAETSGPLVCATSYTGYALVLAPDLQPPMNSKAARPSDALIPSIVWPAVASPCFLFDVARG